MSTREERVLAHLITTYPVGMRLDHCTVVVGHRGACVETTYTVMGERRLRLVPAAEIGGMYPWALGGRANGLDQNGYPSGVEVAS